jgi:hypothetical protein
LADLVLYLLRVPNLQTTVPKIFSMPAVKAIAKSAQNHSGRGAQNVCAVNCARSPAAPNAATNVAPERSPAESSEMLFINRLAISTSNCYSYFVD